MVERLSMPRKPQALLRETREYVQKNSVNPYLIRKGLTHAKYQGIQTASPIAVGYACALAEFYGIAVANITDIPQQEETIDALFFQLFTEQGRGKNPKEDYNELLQRTEGAPLYLIIHTENTMSFKRRSYGFPTENIFHNFLKILTARENTRIIVYGSQTNELPRNITQSLLPIPEIYAPS